MPAPNIRSRAKCGQTVVDIRRSCAAKFQCAVSWEDHCRRSATCGRNALSTIIRRRTGERGDQAVLLFFVRSFAARLLTMAWSASGVAAAGLSAGPAVSDTAGNSVAIFHLSRLREKMLRQRPDNAIGTTGTGVRASIRVTPGRKGPISPLRVNCPSGNMQTSCPSSSAAAISS